MPAGNDFVSNLGRWLAQPGHRPAPAPTVTSIDPAFGTNEGTVTGVQITGTGFLDGATVKLARTNLPDIAATNVVVDSETQITCDLDLNAAATGTWDVVVTNPHDQQGVLRFGFRVGLGHGSLAAWGYDGNGQVSGIPSGNDYVAVAGGEYHSLALKSDGSLEAWGGDYNQQVSNTPTTGTFTAIAAGFQHNLALRTDGSIAAWGYDNVGQVSGTPGGTGFVAVAAGGACSMAIKSDGSIVTWGYDYYGQVTNTPSGKDFVAVATSGYHCLALKSDGSIAAWGWDSFGQTSQAPSASEFVAIAEGSEHCLAIKSDGSLVAWGYDNYGQVTGAPAGTDYVAIAAGAEYCLALKSNGTIVGWGNSNNGRINVPGGTDYVAIAAGLYHGLAIAQHPAPTVTGIDPASGHQNQGLTGVKITGSGFYAGAEALLRMDGQPDIATTNVVVDSDTQITGDFDLTGAATGDWDVVVTNHDLQSGYTGGWVHRAQAHGQLRDP